MKTSSSQPVTNSSGSATLTPIANNITVSVNNNINTSKIYIDGKSTKKMENGLIYNWMLRNERKRRGWTQAKVAEALGVATKTIVRWECGRSVPFPYYREKLSILFGKTAHELGLFSNTDEGRAVQNALSSSSQNWGLEGVSYSQLPPGEAVE